MATVSIALLAETRNITNGVNETNKKLGTLGKAAKSAGGLLVAGIAGQQVVNGFKSVVKAASDSQQSIGATETVFGKYANTVVKDSKRAASEYGLSANTYRENANLIGSLFKNQGVATGELAGKTEGMIKTASDLAATFGGTTTSAVEALSSAFKGEFDPLERYGISLKQSSVNAEASAIAQSQYGKSLDELSTAQQAQVKQQASSNLIMKQSKDSAGAFKKETNTLAHQQQVLAAQFDNVKVAVGTRLLPVLTKAFAFVTKNGPAAWSTLKSVIAPLVPVLSAVGAAFKVLFTVVSSVTGFLNSNKTAVMGIAAVLGTLLLPLLIQTGVQMALTAIRTVALNAAWLIYAVTVKSTAIATQAYTAAQWLLNAAMTANPIGLLVVAIAALVAGLIIAYKKSETFRKIVNAAFLAIKTFVVGAVRAVINFIKNNWKLLLVILTGPIGAAAVLIAKHWGKITAGFKAVYNAVRSVAGKVVGFVKGLPGKILSALGNLGNLLFNAGKAIIQGLINGITGMIGSLTSKVKSITSLIPKLKGPMSYDKVMLKPAGKAIIQGLIDGFDDKEKELRRSLRGTSELIAGGLNPSLRSGSSSLRLAGSGGMAQVNITVVAPVGASSADIGRELQKNLDSYYREGGRARA